jgi:hypothetical protein
MTRHAWLLALGLLLPCPVLADDPILPGSAAADLAIERKCQLDWPDNYSMRVHCERTQRAAARDLQDAIYDVPPRIAAVIQKKCAGDWPDNFSMRLHCQKSQIKAAKELKNP